MAARRGGDAPGILTLLDLIEEHRGPFEYDWRTRFGMALEDVPERMSYGEAWRLLHELLKETGSHVAAALLGWQYPQTREAFVLADVWDLLARVNSKSQPPPYPRPTDAPVKRQGRATASQEDIRAALAARGPVREGGEGD